MPKQTALSNYDDEYLECRDLKHVWKNMGFYHGPAREIRRDLECTRCGVVRTDRWSRSGERLGASYTNRPEDYLITGRGHQVAYTEVRREVLARASVYSNQDDMYNAAMSRSKRKRAS